MDEPLWQPAAAAVAASNLTAFAALASQRTGRDLHSYAVLHRWSLTDNAAFWQLVAEFTNVHFQQAPATALDNPQAFPGARYFPDARLNFAENLLRVRDERTALISVRESGARQTMSYAELARQTAAIAAWLRSLGVTAGDRVAGWLPNTCEAVVAMLATASIGAVWSSCSPDFGAAGALDRFGQIEPKVLFVCDGYQYNGKIISTVSRVREVDAAIDAIEATVWVEMIGQVPAGALRFAELVTEPTTGSAANMAFAARAFNDPLYVMYSSGTTGKPKCIVHSIGGTLLQHLKEHNLHVDLRPTDTLFFFTTCGWMMWNWLVSGLASGCTLVLYEGSPFHPGPEVLWQMAERERISVLGVSARYLSALGKSGWQPQEHCDLRALRAILSTGSPLNEDGFEFVYRNVKADVHLASMSGGTDLISCFVLGNPNLPVYSGEIQCAGLGMAVEVRDVNGAQLNHGKGELVCSQPFPSCPIGFWRDPGNEKFLDAYFRRFPGVWAHGDFAEITTHGGFIIHGRSDAVLNPGGVRIGTAEIYRQVEQLDAIAEAVCVGQEWEDDTRIVLFVVMQPGQQLTEALEGEIRSNIKANASPRHVPARIIQVEDIPRTLSGKIVEVAVREVIHGRPVTNTSALANPEALDHFRNLAALNR